MGVFKDLRDASAIGREMSQDYDPAERVRAASRQMQQVAAQPTSSGVTVAAMVVALADTGALVNMAPMMSVELTILPTTDAAYAVQTTVHGHAALTRCVPGQLTHVVVDPNDPHAVALG